MIKRKAVLWPKKNYKTRADQTGTHKLFAASFQSYFWELKGIGTGKKALTIDIL